MMGVDNAPKELRDVLQAIPPVPNDKMPLVKTCIELEQSLNDLWQLYGMFCWNYDRCVEGLDWSCDGKVQTRSACANEAGFLDRTWADANCYATNLISSGVALTESLRCFMKQDVGENTSEGQRFVSVVSELYETDPVYMLFSELRHEAQHGQALVSVTLDQEGHCCAAFDLDQIARPMHFTMKGKFKKRLDKIVRRLDEAGADTHRLSYGMCVLKYIVDVLRVTQSFYSCSKQYIQAMRNCLDNLIRQQPECYGNLPDGRRFMWFTENEEAHVFCDLETPTWQLQQDHLANVKEKLSEAERRFKGFKRTMSLVEPTQP